MNTSLQPVVFYHDSSPVYFGSYDRSSLSPEEQVSEAENTLLASTEHLPENEQQSCKRQIRNLIAAVRSQIQVMRSLNTDSQSIRNSINQRINDFNASLDTLYGHNANYERRKTRDTLDNVLQATKIHNTTLELNPFVKKERQPAAATRTNSLLEGFKHFPEKAITNAATGVNEPIAFSSGAVMPADVLMQSMGDLHALTTATKVVGNGVAEIAKLVLCGSSPEGREVCKSTLNLALQATKATVKAVGLKEPIKKVVRYWQSFDGAALAEELINSGVPQDQAKTLARQHVHNLGEIAVVFAPIGTLGSLVKNGATRINFLTFLRDEAGYGRLPFVISSIPQTETKLLQQSLPFDRVSVGQDYYMNRQIKKRTKMIPEDIGIGSLEYFRDKRPFAPSDYHLEGWMTAKKDIFKITLENIRVPEGRLSNWLTVMSNFKKIAKVNQASVLQFEAQIVNKQLLDVMIRRFGEPSIVLKNRYKELTEYQVFKIPIETSLPKPLSLSSNLKNTSSQMRYCGKGECAGTFIRDMKEFTEVPNFVSKKLKRDLVLVQFHGAGTVGVDRSHNWWMIAFKANRLHTLSEVMDKAGLLSTWGERTHVTVARIPKGEHLTTLFGKARKQIDTVTGEMRPGGAIQMRIKGFKPEWIVETRKIPGTD